MKQQPDISYQNDTALDEAMVALAEKIDRWTLARGNEPATAYPPLSIYRQEAPTELISYLQEPSLCLIVQGKKRVFLGEETYYYDKDHYLITAVDLPIIAQIFEASSNDPYLGLTLKLEKKQIAQMLLDDHISISRNQASDRGLVVSKIELEIVQAILRLIDLLEHPADIPVLAPLIQREILYRLLISEQGKRLQQIAMVGSHSHQIARAIEWLKENYAKSFKVEDLATYSGMSTSSLHYHFRALTAMSPLQFQKRLRLNEARQLMLMEQKDATTAAFEVGYESPSQFSREYSRLFGNPPSRDIKKLHETTMH
ncbi:AraC family transcriptional regulator [Desulforhopalus singaporensis]|uniref:Transcriptional regulator, AraC family n=1 Tax=Desulforhopalus singaporensis TaxID=91360 RepID=A0A1H0PT77_9BACT|nr:AraC family transcriptional regulator [Desulforhopalus singaporensis]SDP07739.1 transcriptional regulator, AraC family [Desulforhopalus singaporensis]